MKKRNFHAALLSAAMLTAALLTAGCGNTTTGKEAAPAQEASASMVNPITEYETISEVNELVGSNLMHPGVMGVTELGMRTINAGNLLIGEYEYEVSGRTYTMRSAVTETDISGLYLEENGTAFSEAVPEEGPIYCYTEEWMAARWFIGDVQYVLMCEDTELDHGTFEAITGELKVLTGM